MTQPDPPTNGPQPSQSGDYVPPLSRRFVVSVTVTDANAPQGDEAADQLLDALCALGPDDLPGWLLSFDGCDDETDY